MTNPEFDLSQFTETAARSSLDEVVFDIDPRNIDQAARALARGDLIAMQLYTPGLLVDGTNEEALQKLFEAKQIPYERALRGERPIVSILPLREHRGDLIDMQMHHPEVQQALEGEDEQLLTSDGHALFYRVHVPPGVDYLRVPLIAETPEGERSMVLLWHDNPYVRLFEERARQYKGGPVLLTGSSANPTGQPQPASIEHLHESIIPRLAATVDFRDPRILSIEEERRTGIPIIDLIGHPPTIMRPSSMYEPVPSHPALQRLMGYVQEQQAS